MTKEEIADLDDVALESQRFIMSQYSSTMLTMSRLRRELTEILLNKHSGKPETITVQEISEFCCNLLTRHGMLPSETESHKMVREHGREQLVHVDLPVARCLN